MAVYEQIVQAICAGVRGGRLVPEDQVETEQDLAARLGVSRTTVSRAYEKLRITGVLASKRGRGSYVSENALQILGAKQLRPMRKIGFVVSAIGQMSQTPLWHRHQVYDAQEGITQRLEKAHATLSHICIGRWEDQGEPTKQELAALAHRLSGFDGLLLMADNRSADPVIPLIQNADIPCVRLYDEINQPGISHVTYDRPGAVRKAIEHLAGQGYQSIGYLGPDDRSNCTQGFKYATFHEAVAEQGLTLNRNHVWEVKDHNARRTIEAHLKKRAIGQSACSHSSFKIQNSKFSLPQVFFVASDFYAIQAMSVFQANGIRIPSDLALMSYDDIEEAGLMCPALSTIQVPRYDIGYQAADILLNWPLQGDRPAARKLQYKLIVRESCPELLKIAA